MASIKIKHEKITLLTLFIGIQIAACFAQDKKDSKLGESYFKMRDMFEEGRYEDCAYKAESMTMKDKYRSDAEPYLFLSMCNYRIHEIGGKEEEYPKAYSDAIKYAGKFRKRIRRDIYMKSINLFSRS